jgi:predicted transcriptional regulator
MESGISALSKPTVERFMRRGIVRGTPDASLREVAWSMSNNKIHAIFVVDDRAEESPR